MRTRMYDDTDTEMRQLLWLKDTSSYLKFLALNKDMVGPTAVIPKSNAQLTGRQKVTQIVRRLFKHIPGVEIRSRAYYGRTHIYYRVLDPTKQLAMEFRAYLMTQDVANRWETQVDEVFTDNIGLGNLSLTHDYAYDVHFSANMHNIPVKEMCKEPLEIIPALKTFYETEYARFMNTKEAKKKLKEIQSATPILPTPPFDRNKHIMQQIVPAPNMSLRSLQEMYDALSRPTATSSEEPADEDPF